MATDKVTVLDRRDNDFPDWKPSQEEAEYVRKLQNLFDTSQQARRTTYSLLNNRTPEQYWRDSEQRWSSVIPEVRQKPWQSKVVKPITRNKCIGIIANLMAQFIQPDITAERKGKISEEVADAIGDLVEHSQHLDRYELKQLLGFVNAVSFGTSYIQEDYIVSERKIKEIESWDPITNEAKFEEKDVLDFEGFTTSIVSPFEVYLGNIFEFDMQKQPWMFRRVVMPYATAQQRFANFNNWKFVVPGNGDPSDVSTEEEAFYQAFFQRDIEGDEVEILYYQSRFDDEVAILANGVLLSKVGDPIPYAHKKYNLTKVIFEPVSTRFAYGKSLPDKIQGEQDVVDTLYRMIIDKTFLSIFPPLLAKGNELITNDIIVPGKITPVDTEDDVRVPSGIGGGVGNEINVLTMIERSMDMSTIDPQHLGTPASGERSATQVIEAKQGAQKMLSLFGFMIAFSTEEWLDLRIQNILQFWGNHERDVMDDGKRVTVRNIFQMKEKDLQDGTIGIREIEFGKPEFAPTSEELFKEEFRMKEKGKNIEKIYLNPTAIRNYKFLVNVKANPSQRISPELKKALGLEFFDRFFNNELVSKEKLTRDTIKVMDKNPEDFMKSEQEKQAEAQAAQAQMAQMQGQQEGQSLPGTQNKGNITSQLAAAAQPQLKELITA